MDVGTQLMRARERAGLSREDLARRTKIQLAKIEALEQGAFERLPQGLYLDGLIRACAVPLQLDGDALVRDLHAVRRDTPPVAADDLPLVSEAAPPLEVPPTAPAGVVPPAFLGVGTPADATIVANRAGDDRPGQPVRAAGADGGHGWRYAFAAVLLLGLTGWALYLFGPSRPGFERRSEAIATGAPPATTATQPIPSAPPPDGAAETMTASDRAAEEPSTAPPVSPQSDANAHRRPVSAWAAAPSAAAPAADNLSGLWTLSTLVETSSYSSYEGLQLGYRVRLEQDGTRVTGFGEKVMENGTDLSSRARTPIRVQGTIDGERITLTFVERGARRSSTGRFVLHLDDGAGVLRGRFTSDAARSTGRVEARRQS